LGNVKRQENLPKLEFLVTIPQRIGQLWNPPWRASLQVLPSRSSWFWHRVFIMW